MESLDQIIEQAEDIGNRFQAVIDGRKQRLEKVLELVNMTERRFAEMVNQIAERDGRIAGLEYENQRLTRALGQLLEKMTECAEIISAEDESLRRPLAALAGEAAAALVPAAPSAPALSTTAQPMVATAVALAGAAALVGAVASLDAGEPVPEDEPKLAAEAAPDAGEEPIPAEVEAESGEDDGMGAVLAALNTGIPDAVGEVPPEPEPEADIGNPALETGAEPSGDLEQEPLFDPPAAVENQSAAASLGLDEEEPVAEAVPENSDIVEEPITEDDVAAALHMPPASDTSEPLPNLGDALDTLDHLAAEEEISLGLEEPVRLVEEPAAPEQDLEEAPLALAEEPAAQDLEEEPLALAEEPAARDLEEEPLALAEEPAARDLEEEPLALAEEPAARDLEEEPLILAADTFGEEPLDLNSLSSGLSPVDEEPLQLLPLSDHLPDDEDEISVEDLTERIRRLMGGVTPQ